MSASRDPRFEELDREIARAEMDALRAARETRAAKHALAAHRSYESFRLAVARPEVRCFFCPGFADAPDHAQGCPRFEPVTAAEARAGLRAAYAGDPELASDAEVRACTRLVTGGEGAQ